VLQNLDGVLERIIEHLAPSPRPLTFPRFFGAAKI
jgi:hypothetical protein